MNNWWHHLGILRLASNDVIVDVIGWHVNRRRARSNASSGDWLTVMSWLMRLADALGENCRKSKRAPMKSTNDRKWRQCTLCNHGPINSLFFITFYVYFVAWTRVQRPGHYLWEVNLENFNGIKTVYFDELVLSIFDLNVACDATFLATGWQEDNWDWKLHRDEVRNSTRDILEVSI